jgi:V8-like Glu-specific endopeptidase
MDAGVGEDPHARAIAPPRRSGARTALAVACIAACSGPPPGVDSVARPIIAGVADPGDPAVVELIAFIPPNKAAVCTATVISPHLLLTAGHCIQDDPNARYMVFFGADFHMSTVRDLAPVLATASDPAFDRTSPGRGHDLGVVAFAQALAIAPVPMNAGALGADLVGTPVRYVGYGLADGAAQTGVGVRRQATEPVAEVADLLIRVAPNPNAICEGDSGAPLLTSTPAGELLIGVASYGDDPHCQKNSYFGRLDSQRAWVDEQVRKYDPTAAADAGSAPVAMDHSGGCALGRGPGPPTAVVWLLLPIVVAAGRRRR